MSNTERFKKPDESFQYAIYSELDRLDLTDVLAVVKHITDSYHEIMRHHYHLGDRQLLRELIFALERKGNPISRELVKKFNKALDIFEGMEADLPLSDHEKYGGLVSVLNQTAEGELELREKMAALAQLMQSHVLICNQLAEKDCFGARDISAMLQDNATEFFNSPAPVEEKTELLSQLVNGASMLNTLLAKMVQVISFAKKEAKSNDKALLSFQEAMALCVSESQKDFVDPTTLFMTLWSQVQVSQQEAKRATKLWQPATLARKIGKTILDDTVLKKYAETLAQSKVLPLESSVLAKNENKTRAV
ncbi:MAG: hypothetical protein P4M14_05455 [Gammaproteobacteria bacterium]|nr:hypothetical protein [Gammaproteobacteria bacterium]